MASPRPMPPARVKEIPGVVDSPLEYLGGLSTPWQWSSLSASILLVDYLAGRFVHVSTLFILPVTAAARHRGLGLALPLAVVLPWFRLALFRFWEPPWSWPAAVTNSLVRSLAFVAFAILTRQLRRQADEIRQLRGILPIFSYCKRIRDDADESHAIEQYLSVRTEARFSHGICLACMEKFHGQERES
jgi:hypothetical protein